MEEIKAMLETLVQGCLKARNSEDENKDKKSDDKDAENKAKNEDGKKACNEDVDKRDIIRQIMAIAGKEEASEDVKTIAKLAEKLAYDKSEAGTADNSKAKNKCKNESDKEAYEELKEKTEKAENKKAKNEEKEDDDKEKDEIKKAKNSIDEVKKIFFEGTYKAQSKYISQKEGIELGKELY